MHLWSCKIATSFILNVMYLYIFFSIAFCNVFLSNGANITEKNVITASDIANSFITLFTIEVENNNNRIQELKDKLSKINSYVVDGAKYTELLLNACKPNNLSKINFYNALIEQDHYRFRNNTKSLYLALKEKMNRDDLLGILSERGDDKLMKSARRMLSGSDYLRKHKEKEIAEVVEKYLAEVAMDDHIFDESDKFLRESFIWDPKQELEDRLKNRPTRRIYKGEQTTIKYYPFIVSIHIMNKFWCGGALYWHDLVITSAACLQLLHNNRYYRESPTVLSVRVGSNHSRVGGEVVEALEVFFHPAYDPKTLENNIALIRLRRHLTMNYHRVPKIIMISHNEQGISFSGEVMLLGWGVSKASGTMPFEPLYLQRKILPVYPAHFCKEIYGNKFNKEHMFCAGTMTTGEGACSHDAGGPAVLSGKLVGIISYGPTICGFPDAPTVLTLVGFYSDWIETINETLPGYYRGRGRTTTTTEDPLELFETWKATSKKLPKLRVDLFTDEEDDRDDKKYLRVQKSKLSQEYEDNGREEVKNEKDKSSSFEKEPLQPITTKRYAQKSKIPKNTMKEQLQNDEKFEPYQRKTPLQRNGIGNKDFDYKDINTKLQQPTERWKSEYAVQGGKLMHVQSSKEDFTKRSIKHKKLKQAQSSEENYKKRSIKREKPNQAPSSEEDYTKRSVKQKKPKQVQSSDEADVTIRSVKHGKNVQVPSSKEDVTIRSSRGKKHRQVQSSDEDTIPAKHVHVNSNHHLRTRAVRLQENIILRYDDIHKPEKENQILNSKEDSIDPRNDIFLNFQPNGKVGSNVYKNNDNANIPKIILNRLNSKTTKNSYNVRKENRYSKDDKLTNKIINMVVPKKVTGKYKEVDYSVNDSV